MATINELDCLQDSGNTGVGACYFDPTLFIGAILVPKGYEIDVTSIEATLIAASHNASKASRIFPMYNFVNTTDSTEDKVIQQFNTGASAVVREGYNNWRFQFLAGGVSLMQQLRKMNGTAHDFFFIDAGSGQGQRLIGIEGSTSTKLKAIPSDGGRFWAGPWKLNDGTKVAEYMVEFVFPVRYSNDFVSFVQLDFDITSTVYGLQNVVLSNPSATTAGLFRVKALTQAALTNLGDRYSTELATASAWVATNVATGAAITVSGVTWSSSLECFIVALSTGDTDYPTPPAPVYINLAAPAVLQGLGVDGYESTAAISIATVA